MASARAALARHLDKPARHRPDCGAAIRNGALLLVSENEAIGRDRWRIALTLVWRDGGMLVGGFTMTTRDTLAPGAETSCDVSLLTGRAVKNGERRETRERAVPVAQWSMDRMPEICVSG